MLGARSGGADWLLWQVGTSCMAASLPAVGGRLWRRSWLCRLALADGWLRCWEMGASARATPLPIALAAMLPGGLIGARCIAVFLLVYCGGGGLCLPGLTGWW